MRRADLRSCRPGEVPLALADIHHSLAVDDRVSIAWPDAAIWTAHRIGMVLEGAGFEPAARSSASVEVRRLRSLPDTVGPDMHLLISGLNPSPHAADSGVGFSRPGNRFWPAALDAGIVSVDRDPIHALRHHRVGMTDMVKRTTRRADALTTAEYRSGVERLGALCTWLEPAAVCFVGLAGWRAAVDRGASAGWQDHTIGGRPVYVMPSTSGLNASSSRSDLASHLADAFAGPPPPGADSGP